MALNCSPPPNTLAHGIGVTGIGKNPLIAFIDAFVKLGADISDVRLSLVRDAQAAECPDECKKKTISMPEFSATRFGFGFDARKLEWHFTVGVLGEIAILCEKLQPGEEEVRIEA